MSRDLTIILDDRPGELAKLGEVTGEAGVNLRGLAAFTGEGRGVVHVLVDDEDAPRCHKALAGAHMGIADDRPVLVIDIEDRPGTLGELARLLAEANVNIDLAYTVFGGRKIVIATDDVESARAALS
ncbi:ACT domain-containing protein [Thermopolyspora sp. NPDC052614]|uniref:ACT domain-containing protein n=1 Tax=Thermopolyspora sp. NPDC052614 TaxID=3155682 RepID=UPI00341432D1